MIRIVDRIEPWAEIYGLGTSAPHNDQRQLFGVVRTQPHKADYDGACPPSAIEVDLCISSTEFARWDENPVFERSLNSRILQIRVETFLLVLR